MFTGNFEYPVVDKTPHLLDTLNELQSTHTIESEITIYVKG